MSRKDGNMLVGIDMNYEDGCKKGLEMIENAKKCVMEKQVVDERVLASLDELKEFWKNENIFSVLGAEYNWMLFKPLEYFSKRRKNIKFSEWNKIYQGLLADLRARIISDEDMEVISEIRASKYYRDVDVLVEEITAEEFFGRIEYEILKLSLRAKYEERNYDYEIQVYEFARNKVKEFGVSDSYMVQFLYRELWSMIKLVSISKGRKTDKLIRTLEIYRCTVKVAMDTKEEIIAKYSPCIWKD